MAVAYRHHLQLPTDLVLLVRVIAMAEGLGLQLAPEFNLLAFAEPYLRRFWLESRGPRYVVHKAGEGLLDALDLGLTLPLRLRRLMGQLERGEVTVVARHEGLEDALAGLRRLVNRLTMSILVGALIVGLGLLMLVYHPPGWEEWGGWFFGGIFVFASVFGLGLMWSVWRART